MAEQRDRGEPTLSSSTEESARVRSRFSIPGCVLRLAFLRAYPSLRLDFTDEIFLLLCRSVGVKVVLPGKMLPLQSIEKAAHRQESLRAPRGCIRGADRLQHAADLRAIIISDGGGDQLTH